MTFSPDRDGRQRYRGELGRRGNPGVLRAQATDLDHAIVALIRARDAVRAAMTTTGTPRETLVRDAQDQARLGVGFARAAMKRAKPPAKPTGEKQMRLKLSR